MAAVLASGYKPGTYLSLILVWALPPLMLQLGLGADILWQHRRAVFGALAPITLYLALADMVAIAQGTWTIDPGQSLQIYLGGILPLEEFIFFLLTNTLVVFGMTLLLAAESHNRLPATLRRYLQRHTRTRAEA